ncbi:extracellular solute-binding protein family 1 [Beutenbergia cavernae DSM 12333]|uniref:Extracellular solute-binding protein family 1 n=1 Tax=Beutenbergia cavernae (strain ATCC BAA-8 / DSM 12333 / CCUG 43141 / JCM 11478 / NBRC 16432 / NCIMB 13614 / HKI 0122) TaxID=471853 RepID=C5BVG2_BEUC1|nr:sugar ABC transporter substrate-binding protein [Beutenbergia cavernae]ACQ78402.1 extracellular solute-binding protein family 1 [Beutenbergia cavernae DSM 12333]
MGTRFGTRGRTAARAGALTLAAALAVTLAACSPGSDDGGGGDDDGDGEQTTVTFRLWDEAAAAAYRTSFDEFEEQNPDIRVEVETVPWANYWEALPLDISSGEMADIWWTNTSNFGRYADAGNLLDITQSVGDDHDEWSQAVADLYTRDETLWGVPQLQDSIALFYNKTVTDAAGIDPTTLRWDPSGEGDTFLPAAQAVTTDNAGNAATSPDFNPDDVDVWGFNAQNDLQAIYIDFLGSNGAQYQDGDEFAFDSPEGVESFQYLVDLINTHHVSPPAADTNANGDLARDLFVQGRMAFFQSGQYSLPAMADIGEEFEWGIAPMLEGPEGRVSVVHGVAALGNAATEHPEETAEVLRWLGSVEGQLPLAETGAAFPGAVGARDAYLEYWAEQDVDISALQNALDGDTIAAPVGPNVNAGANAISPIFEEMFLGRIPVPDALAQAQAAGNEAIAE